MFAQAFLCQDIFTSPTQTEFLLTQTLIPTISLRSLRQFCNSGSSQETPTVSVKSAIYDLLFHSKSTHCSEAVGPALGDSLPQVCPIYPHSAFLTTNLELSPCSQPYFSPISSTANVSLSYCCSMFLQNHKSQLLPGHCSGFPFFLS